MVEGNIEKPRNIIESVLFTKHLSIEEVEAKIISDCSLIGMTLPPIDAESVPRFSLPINKIDFASLIFKAYHFRRVEDQAKKERDKQEALKLKYIKAALAASEKAI